METPSRQNRLPKTIEQHEADEKRVAEFLQQAEAYWNETAPYGAPAFDIGRGLELLLHDAKRYAAALVRIAATAEEQDKLIDHREASGQEVSEADRQRWFAYRKVAHIAQEALSHKPASTPTAPRSGD